MSSRLAEKPMPLQLWFNERWIYDEEARSKLIFKEAAEEQIMYVRDRIHALFGQKYERRDSPVLVIGEHTSKSCPLPVYCVESERFGLRLVIRGNFFDWKVSVESDRDVPDAFYRLFDADLEVKTYYCEGFDEAWVYGPYSANRRRFTIELGYGREWLFTFCFLLTSSLGEL